MRRLEHSPSESDVSPGEISPEIKQRRRMLAALAMLLLALIVVVYRNHQYFYSSPAASDQEPSAASSTPQSPAVASSSPASTAIPVVPKPSSRNKNNSSRTKATPAPAEAPAPVTTERAVLPALQVEVVAGDSHRTVQPGSNAVKVDLQPGGIVSDRLPSDGEGASGSPVDASEKVRLSPDASKLVTHQVTPDYPLLAKQMKVQGAVILQALIGKEGTIQDLQVLSGPSILSSAAREAVKQWRFKPYYQSGQAVETQAKITVNFTISTY
jgi:TonB family protein